MARRNSSGQLIICNGPGGEKGKGREESEGLGIIVPSRAARPDVDLSRVPQQVDKGQVLRAPGEGAETYCAPSETLARDGGAGAARGPWV